MPQRNGQNPIRSARNFNQNGSRVNGGPGNQARATNAAGICPSCKAEVPPRPGFRFSALTCPKCGTSMGRK